MNKKTLLTLLVALMLGALGMQAASNYGINVGGKEVNTDNYANVTGGDIASGTVSYNPSTKVLTLTNVSISRTGGDNYGVHNRSVDGLTIRFYGTNNIQSNLANALHLDKATTVECMSGSTTTLRMTAGNNFGRGVVYVNGVTATFNGPGTLNVHGITKSGGVYDPVGFEGTKNSGSDNVLTFSNSINLVVNGSWKSFYKFSNVRFYTCDVKAVMALYDGTPFGQIGNVTYGSSTDCVTPADVEFNASDKTFTAISGATVTQNEGRYLHITSSWALKFTTAQFPDANFRSYLRSLCGTYSGFTEHYFTSTQLQNRTSLDVSSKSISNLTGVNKLTYLKALYCGSNSLTSLPTLPSSLTYLNCVSNSLTSLPSLPSSLTYLNCNNNKLTSLPSLPGSLTYLSCSSNSLTSLPTLPSGIQTVYAGSNRFTTLTVSLKYSLKTLDVSSCTSLTSLTAFGNSALTSLVYSGCTALKSLTCDDNNLSSLGALPSSVTEFACYNNRLTSLPSLPGGLQKLQCYGNQLTSLPSTLPSALTYLDCSTNQLTSLPSLPGGIQTVYARSNRFTALTIRYMYSLKTLDVSSCTSLATLYCENDALTSLNVSGCTVLKTFSCNNNQLTSLSSLPASITVFACESNKLASLPSLPSGLKTLYCGYNQLTSLPTLPSTIEAVYANANKFTTLSITGKSSLNTLDVSNNTSLTSLYCNNNALATLTYSGCTALQTLDCKSNLLLSLGALPSTVTHLNCDNNQLRSLPTLPNGLTKLSCEKNKLTSLTSLPSNLTELSCKSNQLTMLSVMGLSKLEVIDCADNKLTSLTVQGCSSLVWLICDRNQIKGSEMTTLINSLYNNTSSDPNTLWVQYNNGEGNEMSNSDVNTARAKGWIPYKYNGSEWIAITATSGGLTGDVNGDGSVGVEDVNIAINIMLGKENNATYLQRADLNGDGSVSVDEVNTIINIMLGKL